MYVKLSWDEIKRQINLRKHGLDFALASVVLDSRYRLDIPVVRGTEPRTWSTSYVMSFWLLCRWYTRRVMRLVESSASVVPIAKKERPTLSGSKMNAMSREELITALKVKELEAPYVWDGQDEDERPATPGELAHRLALARKRGRPAGSGVKEQVAIRLDKDILEAFRADGQGWQTRINQALRRYLAEHPTQS